jgi:SIT4-associating protein SAP185/190
MIVRIVSSEEAGVSGVINWLANEKLIPRLLALLSPLYPTSMHAIASELLKSIVTLCAPSPFNPQGGNAMGQQAGQGVQPPGTRDNRLVRELVSEQSIATCVGFMLDHVEITDKDWPSEDKKLDPTTPFVIHPLPSLSSVSSSVAHVCNVFVELIRRNNSDFSEPHLFHTLRNRLMSIQAQRGRPDTDDEERARMEAAMVQLSEQMGIVHLGNLISVLSSRFEEFHALLAAKRTQVGSTAGNADPLGSISVREQSIASHWRALPSGRAVCRTLAHVQHVDPESGTRYWTVLHVRRDP